MLEFADTRYLLLLLAVPVLVLGYGLIRRRQRKILSSMGDEALVDALTPSRPSGKGWVRLTLVCLAIASLSIGLARPRIGSKPKLLSKSGSEIMLVLDVSNSMLADDYSPSRLERAKMAISRMVDRLENDHVGMVIFAGAAYVQIPLTADYVSAKMFLSGISPSSVPFQGTATEEALRKAALCFSGNESVGKAIVLISDGEDHEGDPVSAAKEIAESGIRIYTIGVGSAAGKSIKIDGTVLRDKDGNPVVTHLEEDTLKAIAEAGGGQYFHAGADSFGLDSVIDALHRLESQSWAQVVYEAYDEQYAYFYAAAFIFLALALSLGYRKSRIKLFS